MQTDIKKLLGAQTSSSRCVDETIKCQPAKLCKRLKAFKSDVNAGAASGVGARIISVRATGAGRENKGIIRAARCDGARLGVPGERASGARSA